MNKLDLYPVPNSTWQQEYNLLTSDPYVKKKYNRTNNINRFNHWVSNYLPEVKTGGKVVMDIGPGFGEFLEICRSYGNEVSGIDASMDVISVMGNEYMRCAKLMTERQKLDVLYYGFDKLIEEGGIKYPDNHIDIINSVGCFEMMFKKFHIGEDLNKHRNTSLVSINPTDECKEYLLKIFREMYRVLKINGCFIIYFNTIKNMKEFSDFMVSSVNNNVGGLKLVKAENNLIFKFVKVS